MMDNKKIISEFNAYVDGFIECCTSDHEVHELLKAVQKVIEGQEERIAIMSESAWHPKDKPPKCDVAVDVWLVLNTVEEHNLVVLGCYWNGKYRNIRGHDITGWVTHWMEYKTPEPPKDGE